MVRYCCWGIYVWVSGFHRATMWLQWLAAHLSAVWIPTNMECSEERAEKGIKRIRIINEKWSLVFKHSHCESLCVLFCSTRRHMGFSSTWFLPWKFPMWHNNDKGWRNTAKPVQVEHRRIFKYSYFWTAVLLTRRIKGQGWNWCMLHKALKFLIFFRRWDFTVFFSKHKY